MDALILLLSFLILMFLGIPVAYAMGLATLITALWIDILARRNNSPSELAATAVQFDMSRWPAPIVRLYLGQATLDQVLTAAADGEGKTKTEQLCAAYFFSGELALSQGAKDQAARRFRLAVDNCAQNALPRVDAITQLKALGAMP